MTQFIILWIYQSCYGFFHHTQTGLHMATSQHNTQEVEIHHNISFPPQHLRARPNSPSVTTLQMMPDGRLYHGGTANAMAAQGPAMGNVVMMPSPQASGSSAQYISDPQYSQSPTSQASPSHAASADGNQRAVYPQHIQMGPPPGYGMAYAQQAGTYAGPPPPGSYPYPNYG